MSTAGTEYDALIVGAGPAGSSLATFLAREGVSCLMLDRFSFPRDKVCGDGVTPQALYWLDQLGCVDQVLEHTDCCITRCDLYIKGRLILSGAFPEGTKYPAFCTLLDRKRLDHLMVQNALAHGAVLAEGAHVRRIVSTDDRVVVEAEENGVPRRFSGKVLIGADGAGSLVSRHLGNTLEGITKAVSVRGYYEGVAVRGSEVRVYFNEEFFPGYGWLFADDHGHANVGLGYVCDGTFPLRISLKEQFQEFVEHDLKDVLGRARASGPLAGGWAAYCKPARRTGDRVLLVGDAARCGDPLNGGGIHRAMESAALASTVLLPALARDDCSAGTLGAYDRLLDDVWGLDFQSAELLLTFAKNPHLRFVYLELLERIGGLARHDARFSGFASGIFAGMIPQHQYLSPWVLLSALPREPRAWLSLLGANGNHGKVSMAATLARGVLAGARGVITQPMDNLAWGLELCLKAVDLGATLARVGLESLAPRPGGGGRHPGARIHFQPST